MRSFTTILVTLAVAVPAVAENYELPEVCVVDLVDDLELHATEPGILDYLAVKEGAKIRAEDVLARIDTRQPEKQKEVAKYALQTALEKAKDDIEIRYARAASRVARETVAELQQTNMSVAKAVTESDLRQAQLDYERSVLAIEKAGKDKKLAGLEAWTKKAEVEAADMAIQRRTLRAPFNGVVVDRFVNEKEWVNPGDPILRIVRLDELQVEGLVPIAVRTPAELDGCEVTIQATIGNGRQVQATGRVVYVNPILLRGQRAVVRAEINNREESGHWVILPKMKAKMTIHLGTGGVAVSSRK